MAAYSGDISNGIIIIFQAHFRLNMLGMALWVFLWGLAWEEVSLATSTARAWVLFLFTNPTAKLRAERKFRVLLTAPRKKKAKKKRAAREIMAT